MKKILYFCNIKKDVNFSTSEKIINYLIDNNFLVYVEEKSLSVKFDLNIINEDTINHIDLAIVLGGDGTLLKYFKAYGERQIPTIGVNMGRVGALTTVNIDDFQNCFDQYLKDEYISNKQFSLLGTIKYHNGTIKKFNIYNEAIIYRGSSLKLLPVNISINSRQSDEIYADGVIIATPTGSSAYNLSAGGPLLSCDCECYVITPICPQIKGFSSVVIPKNNKTILYLSDKSDEVMVSVDGCEKYSIGVNDSLEISLSDIKTNILKFSNNESIYHAVYKIIDSIRNK